MGLSSYVRVLWKHKWTIVATTLLTVAIAAYGSSLLPTKYAATVVLRVLTPAGGALDRIEYDTRYGDRLMSTYMQIAVSRPVMGELIQKLELDEPPEIDVKAVANTELLEITATSGDPKLSRDIANTLGEILVARNVELYTGSGKTAAEILGEHLEQIEAELDDARSEYNSLQQAETADPAHLDVLASLITLKQSQYASMLEQYEQMRVADTLRTNAISVMEPAIVPEKPAGPPRIIIFGIAGVLGLVGGTSLAFVFEYTDTKLYDSEQVEAVTGLPVVGEIPKMKRRRRKAVLFAQQSFHEEAFRHLQVNLFRSTLDPNQFSGIKGIGPVYAEALSRGRIYTYQQLAAAKPEELELLIGAPERRKVDVTSWIEQAKQLAAENGKSADGVFRSLLITSATPEEGKSTIVANLALALAKSGRRVLAVDGDMLIPSLHRVFALPNTAGFSNVLTGETLLSDAVQDSQFPGLHVLTSGPPVKDRTALLDSPAAKHTIKQALAQFDVVLIDSPALLAVADAAVLAPLVDGVVLVVRRARSNRETVQDACKVLAGVKVNPAGVIVNYAEVPHSRHYRYYHRRLVRNGARPSAPERQDPPSSKGTAAKEPAAKKRVVKAPQTATETVVHSSLFLHYPAANLGLALLNRSSAKTS